LRDQFINEIGCQELLHADDSVRYFFDHIFSSVNEQEYEEISNFFSTMLQTSGVPKTMYDASVLQEEIMKNMAISPAFGIIFQKMLVGCDRLRMAQGFVAIIKCMRKKVESLPEAQEFLSLLDTGIEKLSAMLNHQP